MPAPSSSGGPSSRAALDRLKRGAGCDEGRQARGARSESTAAAIPRWSASRAACSASCRNRPRHRSCRATGMRAPLGASSAATSSSVSPPRSGISPARRWARSASPSARARRALRRCRTSAIRWWPSEFVASRASSVQQPWSGRKTSHSGTSATFRTLERRAVVSTLSWRSTTCSTASRGSWTAWLSTPSACGRTSSRRTGSSSRSECCPHSSRPVSPGTRAYRLVQRHALRCWDEGIPFHELVEQDPEIGPRLDSSVFDLADALKHVDVLFERLATSLPARRKPFMPETAQHVASGKVREIYELDDERLLLVASDRISTFDVILGTEIPDKDGCSAAFPRSGSRGRRTSSRTTSSPSGPTGARPRCGG